MRRNAPRGSFQAWPMARNERYSRPARRTENERAVCPSTANQGSATDRVPCPVTANCIGRLFWIVADATGVDAVASPIDTAGGVPGVALRGRLLLMFRSAVSA